ncbi:MAG: hypothetical protein ACREBF_01350 [Candidatus Micrarchaeales archaeon]
MMFASKGFVRSSVQSATGIKSELLAFTPKSLSEEGLKEVANEISVIFGKAFFNTDNSSRCWPVEKVLVRIKEISFGYLVENEAGSERIGYAIFENAGCSAGNILFIDSIGFTRQGLGLGRTLVQQAVETTQSRIIAGRTQNPNLIKMLRGLKPKSILPIDDDYSTGINREILQSLKTQTAELRNANIEEKTGICKCIYREGRLGTYPIDDADSAVAKIQSRFREIGMDQDNGDALIVAAKLDFI